MLKRNVSLTRALAVRTAGADGSEDSDKTLDCNEREGGSDMSDDYTASSNNTTSEAPFDDAFATPEPRPLMELRASKVPGARSADALSRRTAARPPSHSSFRTPNVGTSNPAEAVKKPRVGGVASGASTPTLRPRKNFRRPLAENDEPLRPNTPAMTTPAPTTRKRKPTSRNEGNQVRLSDGAAVVACGGWVFDAVALTATAITSPPEHARLDLPQDEHVHVPRGAEYARAAPCVAARVRVGAASDWSRSLRDGRVQPGAWNLKMSRTGASNSHDLGTALQALDVFKAMHRVEPYRMAGMDLYSTTLWHLKKEVEISYLAQQVTEFDKLSSEAWCVAGNCFSLQKEHDTALSFFQRVRGRSVSLDNVVFNQFPHSMFRGSSHSLRAGNPAKPVVHVRVHAVGARVRRERRL